MRADCHGTIHPSWIWMAASLSCRLGILQTGFYFLLFFYFWTHGQVLNSLEIVFVPICSRHAGKFSNFLAWHPRTAMIECCKKSYVLFCLAIKKKNNLDAPTTVASDGYVLRIIYEHLKDGKRYAWAISTCIAQVFLGRFAPHSNCWWIWYSTLPFSWKRTTTLFDCFSLIALVI